MKYVVKTSYFLPSLDYFKNELNWDVDSMEEVIDFLNLCSKDELQFIFDEYDTDRYMEEEK